MIHRFVDLLEEVAILSPPYSVLSDFSGGFDGEYNVWIVREGVPTKVTPFDEDGNVDSDEMWFPVLSPDSSRIIYRGRRNSDGAEVLYGVPSSGGTPAELVVLSAASAHRVMHPMWHPDSDQIVYSRGEAGAFGGSIWTTDWAGSTPVNVYTPSPLGGATGYFVYRPQFNHDGTKIAFWLDKNLGTDANEGLYVMDADGSNVTQIVVSANPYRLEGAQFSWANTQDVICYSDNTDDLAYVINDDGTGKTQVSVGETATQLCHVSKYAWAADDSLVYFSAAWSGSPVGLRPYSAETDGSGVTRLNDDHGPDGNQNATNIYRWFTDNRIYFIEEYGSAGGDGKVSSVAIDGTDYRVDHLLSDETELTKFFSGTGTEFN